MSSRAFEENFEATVPTVETVAASEGMPAYPHQSLRATGDSTSMSFRSVVLENPYLRVTVCPDLGGRIVRILDKRTGTEVLPTGSMELNDNGSRGVSLISGISFFGDEHNSPTSMSQVEFVLHQPDEDKGSAAVMTFALLVGSGLSLQTCFTLPPDSSQVLVEMRVHNRTVMPVRYDCGCCVGLAPDSAYCVYNGELDIGIHFDGAEVDDLGDVYCADEQVLAPRDVVVHRMRIVPHTGLGGYVAGSPDMVANVVSSELRLLSTRPITDCKVFLQTSDGQTLETNADLDPTSVFRANLPKDARSVSVRDRDKRELLSFDIGAPVEEQEDVPYSFVGEALDSAANHVLQGRPPSSIDEQILTDSSQVHSKEPVIENPHALPMHLRGIAHLTAAKQAIARGELRAAEASLGDALSTLADDPLTWWLKAVVQRLIGEAEEDRPELLNAHFLSPMEPALRAESYLSQDQAQGSEPNPILKPLVADPDALHECVHLLVEAGLFGEASRLIDEAQRHKEHPLLRYMLAWCLLRGTRMAAEASEQVRKAGEAEIEPPFPWRPFELRAVKDLSTEFPDDVRLQSLLKLIGVNEQRPR